MRFPTGVRDLSCLDALFSRPPPRQGSGRYPRHNHKLGMELSGAMVACNARLFYRMVCGKPLADSVILRSSMLFVFYETPFFTGRVAELMDDDTYRHLQNDLLHAPTKGEVMRDCGGIRKIRLASAWRGKGKLGGLRVIYLFVPEANCIYFITVYGKDEQDDLDISQKRQLAALARQIKETLLQKRRKQKE